MSEPLYLDLKKTALTTTGIIFSTLIAYSLAVEDMVLWQSLVVTLIILVVAIFIAFILEVKYKC